MLIHEQITEHETSVLVSAEDYVELTQYFYEGDIPNEAVYLSLTPSEARALGDALLTASQRVEDKLPHGNE